MASSVQSRVQIAKTSLGGLEILEVRWKDPGPWADRFTPYLVMEHLLANPGPTFPVWQHLEQDVAGTPLCHCHGLCK